MLVAVLVARAVMVVVVVAVAVVEMTGERGEKGCDAGNPAVGPRANKGIFASNLKNLRAVCLTVFPLPTADFSTTITLDQLCACICISKFITRTLTVSI